MRFSLRLLMIATAVVAIGIAIPVGLEFVRKRESALLNEIGWNSPVTGTFDGDAESFATKYDCTTCLAIYNRYQLRADWEGNSIASAAMFHLARMKSQVGLQLCRQHLGSENRRRMDCAVKGVLAYYEVSDDIHFTQDVGACIQDGFNAESPEDIYFIVTLIGSDFYYGNAPDEMIEAWPSTDKLIKAWLSPDQPAPESYCAYEDMTGALQQFDPQAADHFQQIVTILRSCDGKPSDEQREVMGYHRNELSQLVEPLAVLRYAAQHAEYFAERKLLTKKKLN